MKNVPFPKKTVNLTSRNLLHWNIICFKNSCMEVGPIFTWFLGPYNFTNTYLAGF